MEENGNLNNRFTEWNQYLILTFTVNSVIITRYSVIVTGNSESPSSKIFGHVLIRRRLALPYYPWCKWETGIRLSFDIFYILRQQKSETFYPSYPVLSDSPLFGYSPWVTDRIKWWTFLCRLSPPRTCLGPPDRFYFSVLNLKPLRRRRSYTLRLPPRRVPLSSLLDVPPRVLQNRLMIKRVREHLWWFRPLL